jgi:two-component system sensor histidine kinase AlgZ
LNRLPSREHSPDLPDFCQPQAVLLLVLLGLLLATLLALADAGLEPSFWRSLGLAALLIETVVLAACLMLCGARALLSRLPVAVAHVAIFTVIQLLTAGFSVFALNWFIAPGVAGVPDDGTRWILRNVLISAIASLVFLRYLALHRQWQLQIRAEAGARLNALQARIRPHFLFNTLNTIASLVRSRPDEAEQAVLDLSDLLRTGLKSDSWHTLQDELELIRGYLRIEGQRLGPRLVVDWRLDERLPQQQAIPALLVQPLVENAIVHGIARCPEGGRLLIECRPLGARWLLRIANPMPPSDDPGAQGGHRMAQDNIRQRLELAYGERARFRTTVVDAEFIAELELPLEPESRDRTLGLDAP